jgi:hypothetical protein
MSAPFTRPGTVLAGAFALALLVLGSSPATASRLPADPLVTAATPVSTTELVTGAHADSVRAAIADLHGFAVGPRTS